MAIIASKFVQRIQPTVTGDQAGNVVVQELFCDVTAAQLVNGNIIDLGILPAYNTVVDAILVPDDLDTATGMTLDVGIMSGTPGDTETVRTSGAELFAASTAAQAGTATRMSEATGFTIKPVEFDRSIGVKVVAAGTPQAGRIRLLVFQAAADHTTQF